MRKLKNILLAGFSLATLSFTSLSYADFTFTSSAPNVCQSISGKWAGTGTVSHWLIGTCNYRGSGSVSAVNAGGNFTTELTTNKISGSSLCPGEVSEHLTGVCQNGKIVLTTNYGKLNGNFSSNSGNAKGKLTISPGIDVDLSIQFQRAG